SREWRCGRRPDFSPPRPPIEPSARPAVFRRRLASTSAGAVPDLPPATQRQLQDGLDLLGVVVLFEPDPQVRGADAEPLTFDERESPEILFRRGGEPPAPHNAQSLVAHAAPSFCLAFVHRRSTTRASSTNNVI